MYSVHSFCHGSHSCCSQLLTMFLGDLYTAILPAITAVRGLFLLVCGPAVTNPVAFAELHRIVMR